MKLAASYTTVTVLHQTQNITHPFCFNFYYVFFFLFLKEGGEEKGRRAEPLYLQEKMCYQEKAIKLLISLQQGLLVATTQQRRGPQENGEDEAKVG